MKVNASLFMCEDFFIDNQVLLTETGIRIVEIQKNNNNVSSPFKEIEPVLF